jgi:hypothetical protein
MSFATAGTQMEMQRPSAPSTDAQVFVLKLPVVAM